MWKKGFCISFKLWKSLALISQLSCLVGVSFWCFDQYYLLIYKYLMMACYVLGAENTHCIRGIVRKVFIKTVNVFLLWGYILMLCRYVRVYERSWLVSLKVWLVNKFKLDKCLNLVGIIKHFLIGRRNEMHSNYLRTKSFLIG